MVHQATLMQLMTQVCGRANPGQIFATQGEGGRLDQVGVPSTHKDTLGLTFGRVGVSGELQVIPIGESLTGGKHNLHGVPGRCQEQDVITEPHHAIKQPCNMASKVKITKFLDEVIHINCK